MNGNAEPGGFTKLHDPLVQELGLIPAAVLCVALRYCGLSEGVCRASVRTIGARLRLSYTPVYDALKLLTAQGYLEDLTPGRRNRPHRYRDTGKALRGSARQESSTARQEISTARQEIAGARHVEERRLLRDKEETHEEINRGGAPAPHPAAGEGITPKPAEAPEVRVFAQAAGFSPRKQTLDDVIAAVRQIGRRLRREAQPDDLKRFIRAWAGRGWNPYNLTWLYDWAVNGVIPEPERPGERKAQHGNSIFGSGTRPAQREELSPEERERLIRFYNPPRET